MVRNKNIIKHKFSLIKFFFHLFKPYVLINNSSTCYYSNIEKQLNTNEFKMYNYYITK